MNTVILLTAYQGEEYLPPLLDSLSRQTDPDFSVLWQDDGSADRTPSLLSSLSLRDARFRPGSEQGLHLGAKGNFLSLIRQADGDAFLLCDQDDLWEPFKVAELKNALLDAQERFGGETPLLVHSDCTLIDGEGRTLSPSFFRHQGWDPKAVTLPRLLVQNNVTGCTLIMNRSLRDLIAEYARADALFMHDWFIALTAAAFGRVLFLPRTLTRYRQHTGNAVGASPSDQVSRGFQALSHREKARRRIRLTYTHTRAFRESYGDRLPAEAAALADAYLATESLPRLARLAAVRRLGCTMQSPVTRAGQLLFG